MPFSHELILDAAMIPSLPPPGGQMSHSDLMGRPRLVPSGSRPTQPSNTHTHSRGSNSTSVSLDGHGQPQHLNPSPAPQMRAVPPRRPGMALRRVSSFSGSSGNQAGVGAVGVGIHLPAHSLPARSHGKRGSIVGPDRPPPVRRTSSYDNKASFDWSTHSSNTNTRPTLGDRLGVSVKHQRTASESTASTIKKPSYADSEDRPSLPSKDGPMRASSGDGIIRLGRPEQVLEINRLINTLHSLTPPSRNRYNPSLNAASLYPAFILTPLAVILESLVVERQILTQPDLPIPDLPELEDGSTLQLDPGEGEIDWRTLRIYTRSLGNLLDQILPFIQDSSNQDRLAVESMIRSIRLFVGKIKKVFAEVVQGYGDEYGFLKGWWDDGEMKACAGEIGRWCDLFDV